MQHKKINITTILIILILICSLGTACYFGYLSYKDTTDHENEKEDYMHITQNFTQPANDIKTMNLPEKDIALYPNRNIDHNGLKSKNKDYIGWLYFPFIGTDDAHQFTIDYPIVYETYTNQYLRTSFENEYSTSGAIFMDKASNPSFFGYTDTLYGHHMRDDTMFGSLELIHDMDNLNYLQENPQFLYIYTKTACHKYVLIGYEQLESSNSFGYSIAYDNKAYDLIKEHITSLDTYIDSNTFTWTGRPEILNLSTCDGATSGTSDRFLLHFIKIMAYETD